MTRSHPAARRAAELIRRARGRVMVRSLTDELGLSARQLERLFRDHVGVSPKEAARIARFRHAVELMHSRPVPSLAHIAFECGYVDQAHLTREFRTLAGSTPASYRARISSPERQNVAFIQDGVDPAA
jgi:transcriptional regulator GlxA family with amidase domain